MVAIKKAPSPLSPSERSELRAIWGEAPGATLLQIQGRFHRRTGRRLGLSAIHRHRPDGCGRRHAPAMLRSLGLGGKLLGAAASIVRAAHADGDGPMRGRHLAEAVRLLTEERG